MSLEYYQYPVLLLFLLKACVALYEISRRRLKLPTFSVQTVLIVFLAIVLTALSFSFPLSEHYLWLLLLDRLLFIFVCIPIFLVIFPSEIIDDLRIRSALSQLKEYKNLKKILIVGNDASETAYFLEQLLRKNNEVVTVQARSLRLKDISRTVTSEVSEQVDYLIVSYTNLNYASLEEILREITFSSIILLDTASSIQMTKLVTLINPYLTQNQKLLIDHSFLREDFKKKKNIFVFSSDISAQNTTISPTSTQQKKNKLQGKLTYKDEMIMYSTPLIGVHHLIYLIPAVLVALLSGMKKKTITEVLSGLTPLPGQFVEHRLQSGITLIDATMVENMSLVRRGLHYLKLYRKNRVIIFGIEDELTREQIKELKNDFALASTILVTSEKHQLLLRRLMKVGTDKVEVRVLTGDTVARYIRDRLSRDDIVIFLGGRVSPIIESMLLSSSTRH